MDKDEIVELFYGYDDDADIEEALNEISEVIYYSNAVEQIGINNLDNVIRSFMDEFGEYAGLEAIASWDRATEYRDDINEAFNEFPDTIGELREMAKE